MPNIGPPVVVPSAPDIKPPMCFDFGQFGAMPKTSPITTIATTRMIPIQITITTAVATTLAV